MKNNLQKIKEISPIGMRTFKTAISIIICLFVYQIGYSLNVVNYSDSSLACITAIICMRETLGDSKSAGLQRLFGTILGAVLGIAYSYLFFFFGNVLLQTFVIATGIIVMIVICNKAKVADAIVIACVVYLFIILSGDAINPFFHGVMRFIDTLAGLGISVLVNHFIYNPDKRKTLPEDQENPENPSAS